MQSSKHTLLNEFFKDSAFSMINVGEKKITHRKALASGNIFLTPDVLQKVKTGTLEKGDALALAEIAGIQGAKLTANLLPLCHPLSLDAVALKSEINEKSGCVSVYCYVVAKAKTGVEMEAIAGVQAALLCIYDLCKMYGHEMCISDVRLLYKVGGKQGLILDKAHLPKTLAMLAEDPSLSLKEHKAAVLSISDRASKGDYADASGPIIERVLISEGADCLPPMVVPDDTTVIQTTLTKLMDEHAPDLIITTGGTGVGPRDVTPQAISEIIDYDIPGIGELLRQDGLHFTPYAVLSRSIAGIYKNAFIVSLPGSSKAVSQAMDVLTPILAHLIAIIKGGGHD